MESSFISAGAIAVIYIIIKVVEMRVILKETKPIKDLVRDTVIVYLSSILGIFVLDQFAAGITKVSPTSAFTGNPDF